MEDWCQSSGDKTCKFSLDLQLIFATTSIISYQLQNMRFSKWIKTKNRRIPLVTKAGAYSFKYYSKLSPINKFIILMLNMQIIIIMQFIIMTANLEFHRRYLYLCLPLLLLFTLVLPLSSALQPPTCLLYSSLPVNINHQSSSPLCTPCLPQCITCTSLLDQSCSRGNCINRYFYDSDAQLCKRCQNLCQQCIDQNNCQKCIDGYFLNIVGACVRCMDGAKECTASAVILCTTGFYYDSQAYICRTCTDSNCEICSAKGKCDRCYDGYILNSDNTNCLACNILNCKSCSTQNTCQACHIGYVLNTPTLCAKHICSSIQNCKQCITSSSVTCTLCQPGYYLLQNTCKFGSSLLCSYSLTTSYVTAQGWSTNNNQLNRMTDYGSCMTCNESIAQFADGAPTYCMPKGIGMRENIFVDFIVGQDMQLCDMPYFLISELKDKYTFAYEILPSYKIKLTTILIIYNSTLNSSSIASGLNPISISSNLVSTTVTQTMTSYPLFCSSPSALPSSILLSLSLTLKIQTQTNSSSPSSLLPFLLQITPNRSIFGLSSSAKIGMKQLYMELSLCLKDNCVQCLSPNSCTKCQIPYYVQGFGCVEKCDIGFYVNQELRTCVIQCEAGYYYNVSVGEGGSCVRCPIQCVLCSSFISCSKCQTNYFLTIENRCQTSCSSQPLAFSLYYPNSTTLTCKSCQSPCKTCSVVPSNCTSCSVGFQYSTITSSSTIIGTCVFNCPIGYYSKVIIQSNQQYNPKCLKCDSSCLNCESSANLCSGCIDGFFLENQRCVAICQQGYFGDNSMVGYGETGFCRACAPPCKTCILTSSNCSSCQYNLYLLLQPFPQPNKCVPECPSTNYYANKQTNTCMACSDKNCQKCSLKLLTSTLSPNINTSNSNVEICQKCINGLVLEQYVCVSQCSNGWAVDGVCMGCPGACLQCNGYASNFTCFKCTDSYFLNQGSCVLVCPATKYPNITSSTCQSCPTSCKTCTLTISTISCLSCVDNFILHNETCISTNPGCPSTTYLHQSQSKCIPCQSSCLECQGSSTYCISCHSGLYLFNVSNICLSQCPFGWFQNKGATDNGICGRCDSRCDGCDIIAQNCTLCRLDMFMYFNSTSKLNTCLSQSECSLIPNSAPSFQTSQCIPCVLPCLTCSTPTTCLSCVNSTYLYQNLCLQQCLIGYYANTIKGQCLACSSQCKSCSSSVFCLSCKPNYFYRQTDGTCRLQCLDGEFGNLGLMVCESCRPPCRNCANREYCLSCTTAAIGGAIVNLILLQGRCLVSCPDKYYQSSLSCLPCNAQCETCSSPTNCTFCIFGFYLSEDKCVLSSQCPNQYYADSSSRMCQKCQMPCVECFSKYECKTCVQQHYLRDSACYRQCPIGTYINGSQCSNCPQYCPRCLSSTQCLSCQNPNYLYTNLTDSTSICVKVCPIGSYLQLASATCISCSSTCRTCQSRPDKCSSCASNRVLQNNACIFNCSAFYYRNQHTSVANITTNVCESCNFSCSQCVNYQVCQACDSAYLVTSQQLTVHRNVTYNISYCSAQCPLGTYKNSQKFICQLCQQGCLQCKSSQNCLACSSSQGYILYNIKCLPAPCPSILFYIQSQNKCIEQSYCRGNPTKYYIYEKQRQCYRVDQGGCPKYLVYRGNGICAQTCPDGFLVDFYGNCVKTQMQGRKFQMTVVREDGRIGVYVWFDGVMQKDWARLFMNVSVVKGISWVTKNKVQSRLLTSQFEFDVAQPEIQPYKNCLMLTITPSTQIAATDITITVSLTTPYTSAIQLQGYPLQNWRSTTTLQLYTTSMQQLQKKSPRPSPLSVILLIFCFVISIANMIWSGKVYLLVRIWDIVHILYLFAYFNVYWSVDVRLFFQGFGIAWGRGFKIGFQRVILSPERVHAVAGDMHLGSNLICNFVLLVVTSLAYGVATLVKLILQYRLKGNINSPKQKKQFKPIQNQNPTLKKCETVKAFILKRLICIFYLCLPNILFFSLLNTFYNTSSRFNTRDIWFVLAIVFSCLLFAALIVVLYKQISQKNWLDPGINPLKKKIIMYLPIYILIRKILMLFFLALNPSDAAFPTCFALITTVFISVLIYWFEPYYNSLRYRLTLVSQAMLFVFFLFSFIYVCNQKQMMSSGFTGFLVFLGVIALVSQFAYPAYHLYVLLDIKNKVMRICKSKQNQEVKKDKQQCNINDKYLKIGYCIQLDNQEIAVTANSLVQWQKNKEGYHPPKQVETEVFNCSKPLNTFSSKRQNISSKNIQTQKSATKKQRKLKLPKDKLIQGQTDHEADQSSQEGQKLKMTLADFTVRLVKKEATLVKPFKNYDVDGNEGSNDDEDLIEKQIHLSKLIEKQKTLQRSKDNSKEKSIDLN